MLDRYPALLSDWADKLSAYQKDSLTSLTRDLAARTSDLAAAEAREKAAQDLREQEKAAYTRTLQEQTRIAALENEHLRELVGRSCADLCAGGS